MQSSTCDTLAGRLMSLEGDVDVQGGSGSAWTPASLQTELCEGDTVRVGDNSRAAIALVNDAVLRIDERSSVRLVNIVDEKEEKSFIEMARGAIQSFSRKPKRFTVSTPYINGSIEGTEWLIRADDGGGRITVFEGVVVAANDHGSVSVAGGEQADAGPASAPVKSIPVRPRDQVQWGLYFPAVLVDSADADMTRAADMLQTGRVDRSRELIEEVLAGEPGNSDALALRAVLKVVTLDETAVADGEMALSSDSASTAARIALSYAYQAEFRLQDALAVLQDTNTGNSALALARLAEVQLMLGRQQDALASADRAVSLDPGSARAVSVRGFAALAQFRTDDARAAFEQAIELDSADPMNHLGLGLAHVSQGNLAQGRAQVEAAVALDSNSALLRSYLGKSYFEERRTPLDLEQYTIAKELDANDPTAFLYAAIAHQTENRPVSALQDIEASIARNDNRAVYRSRLLLDKDRASRGTSLARVYSDLGFPQLGILSSTQSLALDPANAGAHRFLSDTYRNLRRREVSRVSELLQAQLMQEININPVQPSIAETNLNIVTLGGPAAAGFNEFTPLFQRNKTEFNVSALVGNNETYSGEAVVSGLYDRFSYSLGAFHYESDGFRDNNDIENDVFNLYAQYAVTGNFNLQLELRSRDTEQGDLRMNFDPDEFDDTFRRDFDEDSARVGARWNLNANSLLLFSLMYSETEESQAFSEVTVQTDIIPNLPVTVTTEVDDNLDQDTTIGELQYQLQKERFNLVTGASYSESDWDRFTVLSPALGPPLEALEVQPVVRDGEPELEFTSLYAYASIRMPANMNWTLGVTYQDFEQDEVSEDEVSPKLGLRWNLTDRVELRAAYFETIKSLLAGNRTIEPTQVAGFNQFYDDANGTKTEGYGAALDWNLSGDWKLGLEYTGRDFDRLSADFFSGEGFYRDHEESTARAYAYWTPLQQLALGADLIYEDYEGNNDELLDEPTEVETFSLPVTARYFHDSGFFGGLVLTYVDQEVTRPGDSSRTDGETDFFLVDLAVGYRLAQRRGIISATVKNLFDEEFDYQDDSFLNFGDQPALSPYIPEVAVIGRVSLNF